MRIVTAVVDDCVDVIVDCMDIIVVNLVTLYLLKQRSSRVKTSQSLEILTNAVICIVSNDYKLISSIFVPIKIAFLVIYYFASISTRPGFDHGYS